MVVRKGGRAMKQHRWQRIGTAVARVGFASLVSLLGGSLPRASAQVPYPPGTILTVAGNGTSGFSGDGGPATQAQLNGPSALAFDAFGDLFIGEGANACVRRVGRDGIITTVAGTGGVAGYTPDGGPATQAVLGNVWGVAVDAAGQ